MAPIFVKLISFSFGYLYDYITNFTCLVITILQNKDAMAQMAER